MIIIAFGSNFSFVSVLCLSKSLFDINMQINNIKPFLNTNFNSNNKKTTVKNEHIVSFSLDSNPIAYLNKAQISFCAMKKSQFDGIDLIMIERAKLPISKFNSNEDLQDYCQKILDEEYFGEKNLKRLSKSIDRQAKEQKEVILKSWIKYITKENVAYTPVIQLFILSSITKNLNPNTNYLPPTLNKGVLASTISDIVDRTKQDRKFNPNFEKTYKNNIQKSIFEKETQLDSSLTGWIKIPSSKNDPRNFEANVLKLQTLSHNNWCTKTYNARPYLKEGDFWVYLEQGKPKLGVRFEKNKIAEIQPEENNGDIPVCRYEMLHSFIDKNKFELSYSTQYAIEEMDRKKETLDKLISKIGQDAINEKDWEKILLGLEIEVEKDENGMLILSEYSTIIEDCVTFEDLGLNEKELFEKIIKIKGDAYLNGSKMEDLGNLEEVGGNFQFYNSKIKSLSNLKRIGGHFDCGYESKLETLGKLEYIGNTACFDSPLITSLENLEEIGNIFKIGSSSRIFSLGKLRKVGGYVDISNRALKSLGNLEEIGASLCLTTSGVRNLGNLKRIGGTAIFGRKLNNLGNLEYIGSGVSFTDTNITSLGNLKTIRGYVRFANSKVTDLGKLERVNGLIDAYNSLLKEEDFKNIQNVGLLGFDY